MSTIADIKATADALRAQAQSLLDQANTLESQIAALTPAPAPAPTPTPAPAPVAPVVTTTATLPTGVTLKDIDGGATYYDKWPAANFPGNKTIYPVGRWAASDLSTQAQLDANKGIVNTFMEDGYTYQDGWWQANLNSTGFYGWGDHAGAGGYFITDEVDQWAGNGWGAWTGTVGFQPTSVCKSGANDCGYTALKDMRDGATDVTPTQKGFPKDKPQYANWGKVAGTGADKPTYQQWASMVDMMSCDVYFEQETGNLTNSWWGVTDIIAGDYASGDLLITDPRLRLARNYGRLVRHQRDYIGDGSKPVWSFHELVDVNGNQVDPRRFNAGLWSAVISGARGVIYFTHNYIRTGGYANSFEDPAFAGVLAAAKSFYTSVQSLATVINSPDAVGFVTTDTDGLCPAGWPTGVEVLAKWNNGAPYLFAHHAGDSVSNATATFTLAGGVGTSVTVVGESRTIPVVGGKFTDTFADSDTVHIYQLTL